MYHFVYIIAMPYNIYRYLSKNNLDKCYKYSFLLPESLDQKTGAMIMDMLQEINSKGWTVILVTHDINIANQCNRKIIINDGCIVE